MSSWGSEGPPPEAYGRVTDPERFRGLHQAARDLFDDLETRYKVRRERFLDHTGPAGPEPAERLVPSPPCASPLTVTYSESPGLVVYTGRGEHGAHIPVCACDACAETLETCTEQLSDLVEPVVAGTFGENLSLHDGRWHLENWRTWPGGYASSRSPLDDHRAEQLLEVIPDGELTWTAWQPRFPRP